MLLDIDNKDTTIINRIISLCYRILDNLANAIDVICILFEMNYQNTFLKWYYTENKDSIGATLKPYEKIDIIIDNWNTHHDIEQLQDIVNPTIIDLVEDLNIIMNQV